MVWCNSFGDCRFSELELIAVSVWVAADFLSNFLKPIEQVHVDICNILDF